MVYLQPLLVFGVIVACLQPSSGLFFGKKYTKKECPANPPGISSFRPMAGTRLYYAWSTVQGTARAAFLRNTLCRGGHILDCSCIGYDVVGYDRVNVETQEGFTFAVNKKLGKADLYRFRRPWPQSRDYCLRHYDINYQYGTTSKYPDYHSSSYYSVWANNPNATVSINKDSRGFKVLAWTPTVVVFYNCASSDADIRVYTTYVPSATAQIPNTVFDILQQVGININNLLWLKLDHNNCVYPNPSSYTKLLSKKY